jgi:SAM-dependent methyltransferase
VGYLAAAGETEGGMSGTGERAYFLGHSDAEVERLALQNAFYRDATENTLRRAGLTAGMRVLDIGSGGGDVSLLAAEVVSPSGFVLGIDRSPEAVAAAGRKADRSGIRHVRFAVSELEAFAADAPFDAADRPVRADVYGRSARDLASTGSPPAAGRDRCVSGDGNAQRPRLSGCPVV